MTGIGAVISNNLPILAIAIPLLGGFFIPLLGILAERAGAPKAKDYFALIIAILTFLCMIPIAKSVVMDGEIWVYQLAGRFPPWGINLAIDGLSLLAGIIASGMTLLVVVFSIGFMDGETGLDKYYLLLLIMCAGMIGISFTGDVFNLYVFFEIMSISSYALVAFYRSGKSLEGSFKYLVMGTVGTVSILWGVAIVYGLTGTLNIADLSVRLTAIRQVAPGVPISIILAIALFVTGFGIKIGMVPLHTWLPDAYQAAPSSIAAILAGGTTVVGVAALLRVTYLLFYAFPIGYMFIGLGLITMVVGAFMALVQDDLKRLLAYSGISQMGYILLGVGIGGLGGYAGISVVAADNGFRGGLFHMLNNAIYKPLLFLCAGAVIYRVGTSKMDDIGGLARKMPVTAVAFIIGALALAGIPPLNGFLSKWTIYVASYQVNPILTVIAVVISGLTLAYLLKAFSMVFLGPTPAKFEDIQEAPASLLVPMVILAALCIVVIVLPLLDFPIIKPAWKSLSDHVPYIKAVLGGVS
ncbi:hypothetical protein AKJ38_01335 [candidate division MSBL1 archaeon SCGC-AAA259I14]|uniref:NADH:quinone oxidoreductase/Mrp antiporter membrane subunit domain-containing protein n=1 Tax=candidate division MSBL1 archaeon SCGC-AAA259I14 TaxID=1698268 RepID=A0A133UT42_9EURY|nr:hypothetical protein AKJ38_01335 [candidate division MSBL1 archaeon SCGC-AAA259I14]